MRIRVVLAALATLALPVVAACGQGAKTASTTSSQSGSATVKSNSPQTSRASVGKAFWYAGFKVTVTDATLVKPPKPSPGYTPDRPKLIIHATFENLGPDNASPYYIEPALQSGTNSYLDHDGQDEKIPQVPGQQSTDGTIAFFVDDKFRLDNAELLIGSARYNQPMVPLGTKGRYVSLEPQQVAVSGTITLPGAFTLAVSGGDLSFDDSKSHQEENAGDVNLLVHYAITGTGNGTCCFGQDNAILKLPDGTAMASVRASGYGYPANGLTTADQFVQWTFKGADGAYDFIVKGKYGPDNADEQADLPFQLTLGLSASAAGTPPAGGAYPSPSPVPEATPTGH